MELKGYKKYFTLKDPSINEYIIYIKKNHVVIYNLSNKKIKEYTFEKKFIVNEENSHTSLLLKLSNNKYCLIESYEEGSGIFEFTTKNDTIKKFYSIKERAQGILSYAVGEKYVYDLTFQKYLSIKAFTKLSIDAINYLFSNLTYFEKFMINLKTHKKIGKINFDEYLKYKNKFFGDEKPTKRRLVNKFKKELDIDLYKK